MGPVGGINLGASHEPAQMLTENGDGLEIRLETISQNLLVKPDDDSVQAGNNFGLPNAS
ncbi:hypothetical protein D3C72_2540080 [compost metagenome]